MYKMRERSDSTIPHFEIYTPHFLNHAHIISLSLNVYL